MPARILILLISFVTLLPIPGAAQSEHQEGFKVVVHPSNPTESISREELSRLFLKRQTRWEHGEVVVPVDHRPSSPTREQFASTVLKRGVDSIKSYWNQMIFSGRAVPPVELDSDDEVLRLVESTPGAVGYVSSDAEIGERVKILEIAD